MLHVCKTQLASQMTLWSGNRAPTRSIDQPEQLGPFTGSIGALTLLKENLIPQKLTDENAE
jgi:hypothetical protein